MKIFAVIGPIGAGKSTISKLFEENNYKIYRLSHSLVEAAKKEKIDTSNRESMQNFGDRKRQEHGNDYLAKLTYQKIIDSNHTKVIIESIRILEELEYFKNKFQDSLKIISVDLDLETRYKRSQKRGGKYDKKTITLEEFKKHSTHDLGNTNTKHKGVRECMKLADIKLINSKTPEELKLQLKKYF